MKNRKNKIDKLRFRVDRIDTKLLKLLVKRYRLVSEIGKYKRLNNQSIIDKSREDNILSRFRSMIKDNSVYSYIENIYRAIFKSSYRAETTDE